MNRQALVFTLIVSVLLGWGLSEILLLSQNNLFNNHRWIVSKRMKEMGLTGADEFLVSRDPLAHSSLNLGSWYGSQEVVTRQPFAVTQIEIKPEIPDPSFLDLFVRDDAGQSYGFRLSRAGNSPSFAFSEMRGGKFLSRENFPSPSSISQIEIKFSERALRLFSGSVPVAAIKVSSDGPFRFGLRSGPLGAALKEVRIHGTEGLLLKENFSGRRSLPTMFVLHGVAVFLLSLLVFFLLQRLGVLNPHFWVLQGLLTLILASAVYSSFDRLFWSQKPFHFEDTSLTSQDKTLLRTSSFENRRRAFFQSWGGLLGFAETSPQSFLNQGYPLRRLWVEPILCRHRQSCNVHQVEEIMSYLAEPKRAPRVVLLGGSQTFGAGADHLSETFFSRIHQAQGSKIDILNLAQSGARVENLRELLNGLESPLNADLVLINIGSNDIFNSRFESSTRSLIQALLPQSRSIVLLLEAVDSDQRLSKPFLLKGMKENHRILKKLSAEFRIPALSFYEYISSEDVRLSGHLWWDQFHLSSWGQQVFADWLLENLDFSFPKIRKPLK